MRHADLTGLTIATALLVGGFSSAANGQGAAPDAPPANPPPASPVAAPAGGVPNAGEDPWRIQATAFAWMVSLNGKAGVRGREADVDASFKDILDDSSSLVAVSGRLEVGYKKFGAYVDAFYADIGADHLSGPFGLADIEVTVKQTIVDFGVMYRIGEWEAKGEAAKNPAKFITLDLYGGGRYSDLELEVNPARLPSRSKSDSWVDPIVGAKLVVPIAEHWVTYVSGDIGGFGAASDFTWGATGVVGYTFMLGKMPSTIFAGYRAISWDYTKGSGNDEFKWDIVEHGPMLGFSMRF